MQIKRGVAVSPGVVTGEVLVLGTEDFRIPNRFVSIDAVESELGRFRNTLEMVWEEIEENERLARDQLGDQFGAIFGAHLQMARDPKLIAEIEGLISEKSLSPEFASSRVLRRFARELQNLGNQYHAERAVDIFDLEKHRDGFTSESGGEYQSKLWGELSAELTNSYKLQHLVRKTFILNITTELMLQIRLKQAF